MTKLNNIIEKSRSFFISEWFMAILFVVSSLITIFKAQFEGTLVFILLVAVLLIVCDDLLVTTLPFMLLSVTATKLNDSYDRFIVHWWILVVLTGAMFFHFIFYRKKKHRKNGQLFWPILIVSVAVTLNGVGVISAKEYFLGVSLYNIAALGFATLLAYELMVASFRPNKNYDINDKFTNILITVLAYCCFMIIHKYIVDIHTFMAHPRILQFQWRNNVSTFIMLTMPMAFYRTIQKPGYLVLGLLSYVCLLLGGSRGGMLFGGIELVICVILLIVLDKKRRKTYCWIFGAILVLCLASIPFQMDLLSKTLERFTSRKENFRRLGLWQRAIQDFKSNPITGRGLAYFGNRDLHPSKKFALCWYHSSPFQIIGSFGILGIVAYGYQYYARIKMFAKNRKNLFNIFLFTSYIGLELMSLVNPGIFSPVPYLIIATIYFVMIENCTTEKYNQEYVSVTTYTKPK